MKWMVICLYISRCGNGYEASSMKTFESKEECDTYAAKDVAWLKAEHKEGRQENEFSFQCVEINP